MPLSNKLARRTEGGHVILNCAIRACAIFDQDEEVIVSFIRAHNDWREIRANTFASWYLMPPAFLQHISEPRQWTTDKAIHWANALKVSTEALAIALSETGFIDNATMRRIRGVRVPRDMKEDPELPETLSPRSRERKEELLRGNMDHIDVHDLSEEEARLLAAFVEFLRRQRQERRQQGFAQAEATPPPSPFVVWPLGVKGTLSREEIYDDL